MAGQYEKAWKMTTDLLDRMIEVVPESNGDMVLHGVVQEIRNRMDMFLAYVANQS